MKDLKDVKLQDFVFKDEPETIEKDYISRYILNKDFGVEIDLLYKNKEFLLDVDEIFKDYNPNLTTKKLKERKEFLNQTLCNPDRGYILRMLIIKHILKIMQRNLSGYVDKNWYKDSLNNFWGETNYVSKQIK